MSKKVDYDFMVEYAKSDRSSCRTTKEKIPKGAMRIGQMVQAPNFDGKIPQWCADVIYDVKP
jgi:poly [ADP-ribose] polymerase